MPKIIVEICNKIIEYSFYLLAIVVPLVLTPKNYELFEYNKMMTVYAMTVVILGAWAVKLIVLKKAELKKSPFDAFLILFLISQILSTLFSLDVHTSIWGYYSRFHGGLLSTISYCLLYFAFTNNINSIRVLKNLLYAVLSTACVVAVYGILEHFGIDKDLWVQDVQNRVFSTLGQPNWLGAYMAVVLPMTMGVLLYFVTNKGNGDENISQKLKVKSQRIYLKSFNSSQNKLLPFDFCLLTSIILSLIFYITLLFTKSRSGVLGFWTADIIFGLLLFLKPVTVKLKLQSFKQAIKLYLILNTCYLILSFVIGGSGLWVFEKFSWPVLTKQSAKQESIDLTKSKPTGESVIATGVTESGEIRRIVWKGALNIFANNPIFGTGVETFAYAYYRYRPVEHNMTSEWDFLYNKAHNEFLNYLATTGIVGFGTFMGFILAYVVWIIKKCTMYNVECTINNNKKSTPADSKFYIVHSQLYIILGLFTGWLSILVTDFLGFSVVVIGLFFFLIPAASFVFIKLIRQTDFAEATVSYRLLSFVQKAGIISCFITVVFLELTLVNLWVADTYFAKGYRQNRALQFADSYGNLSQALKMNPGEPFYADEMAYASAILAAAISRDDKNEASTAGILAAQAEALSDKVTSENPGNINYLKSKIRIFYALSQIDSRYKAVVLDTLLKTYKLAPTDPKIAYNLAVVLAQSGQTEKARQLFLKTILMKPDFKDAYFGLALLYKDLKRDADAQKTLEFILAKLDPSDELVKKKLLEWEK